MAKNSQVSVRGRPGAALGAATIISLPLGSIYAFSVLLVPLEQLLQANRSELASVFGISAVFFTIGANLVPRLFGWIRAPLLVALTGALSAAGVALAAVAPSLTWLILGYGVLFAAGGGMVYVVVQQCVNAAQLARPGLVNGYLVSLFPLGAMLAAPAFGLGLDWVGVRQTLAGLAAGLRRGRRSYVGRFRARKRVRPSPLPRQGSAGAGQAGRRRSAPPRARPPRG